MIKEKKTRSQLVLDALLTGKSLSLTDITKMVSMALGKELIIKNIRSLMAKLLNTWTFPIGYFIIKNKTPQGYEYSLAPEILSLTPEEIYDLACQTGKDRFTLEMALKKVPELRQYVKKTGKSAVQPAVNNEPDIKEPVKKLVTTREKTSIKKPGAAKGKPVLETKPTQPELVTQTATVEDVAALFLDEIKKAENLKVNVNLKVRFIIPPKNWTAL